MATAVIEKEYWTDDDMRERYGYSPKTLQRLRKNDGLPSFKAKHGPRLYPIDLVLKWAASRVSALAPARDEGEAEAAPKREVPRRVVGGEGRRFGRDGRKGAV